MAVKVAAPPAHPSQSLALEARGNSVASSSCSDRLDSYMARVPCVNMKRYMFAKMLDHFPATREGLQNLPALNGTHCRSQSLGGCL
jgi:hypothetical protein